MATESPSEVACGSGIDEPKKRWCITRRPKVPLARLGLSDLLDQSHVLRHELGCEGLAIYVPVFNRGSQALRFIQAITCMVRVETRDFLHDPLVSLVLRWVKRRDGRP